MSRTASASVSRSSWAISSRPVASGTGWSPPSAGWPGVARPRPGPRAEVTSSVPTRVVALAPALRPGRPGSFAQLRMPCISASGRGGQPGTCTSIGHELVRRHERVVVEHAHRGAAGAHRDRPLRLEHLVVDAPDDRRHLDRHPAREDRSGRPGAARRGTPRSRSARRRPARRRSTSTRSRSRPGRRSAGRASSSGPSSAPGRAWSSARAARRTRSRSSPSRSPRSMSRARSWLDAEVAGVRARRSPPLRTISTPAPPVARRTRRPRTAAR